MTTKIFLITDKDFTEGEHPIVVERSVRRTATRPCVRFDVNIYALNDAIHEWFVAISGPDYYHGVHLEFRSASVDEQARRSGNYWRLVFGDADLAMLFKLAWCGR